MGLSSRSSSAPFKKFLGKIPVFSKERPYSLACLNISQFLGAMNDNMFKLILVFMMISIKGPDKASFILSSAGALFVIPFLFFSSSAGILADRFSKQRLLVVMKLAEILIMFLSLFAFAAQSAWGGYTLLFCLATHSAIFGPSKYGIIPEIVPKDKVSSANGLITAFTYLAIIFGTFFASFLTEITNRHFVLAASFCFLMAIVGCISALGIKKTEPQGSKKRMNPFFLREIYQTLVFCKNTKHLFISVCGSAYFLFVGAFTQLNIIPYAIQPLGLSDVAGGYLFLPTALGIAIGSFFAGKASKKQIELGLSCLSGLALGILFILLSFFSKNLVLVSILLVLLGVFGGSFIVPFDSYTQLTSPPEKRGQVIASANFLGFCGVLLASIVLYFFGDILNLNPAIGFAIIGICTLCISLILFARLSDLSLSYIPRKLLSFKSLNVEGESLLEKEASSALIIIEPTLQKILLLLRVVPNVHFFVVRNPEAKTFWFYKLFYSVHFISEKTDPSQLLKENPQLLKEQLRPCFLFPSAPSKNWKFFSEKNSAFIYVNFSTSPDKKISFSHDPVHES
jgi:acyl-[acyl-carrier-protein]-phospholipid O-acyltransferase/long-chain-fatty-acid--[acyl-carrier-protein] ligase